MKNTIKIFSVEFVKYVTFYSVAAFILVTVTNLVK